MTIRVLLFASWAEAFGTDALDLEFGDGATVADVVVRLRAQAGHRILPRPSIAINRRIAEAGARLASGDEVAVIPPVAGG